MGFFPCVSPLMDDQVGAPTKAFSTVHARVRLLPSMESLVSHKARFPVKALPTFKAVKLFFSCVCPLVSV